MATQPSSSSQAQSIDSSVKLFKPPLPDIRWKYNSVRDLKNLRRVTCDFCLTESTGGISRAKQHQLGKVGNVRPCTKTPEEVKLILYMMIRMKERQNSDDKIDPVILDDINASNEWLLGDEARVEEQIEAKEDEEEYVHHYSGGGSDDEDFHDD